MISWVGWLLTWVWEVWLVWVGQMMVCPGPDWGPQRCSDTPAECSPMHHGEGTLHLAVAEK